MSQRDGYSFEQWLKFERRKHRRVPTDTEWQTLASRLGLTALEAKAKEDPEFQRLLGLWSAEVPQSIDWYERAKQRTWMKWRMLDALVIAFFGGAACLLLYQFFRGSEANTTKITAEVGLVAGALVAAIRVLTGLTDVKAEHAIFWEASANLKSRLYAFEDSWRARVQARQGPLDNDAALSEFKVALREQIRHARDEVAREQAAFFRSRKSPAELVDIASAGLDLIRSRGEQLQAAKLAIVTAHRRAALANSPELAELNEDLALAHRQSNTAQQRLEILVLQRERMLHELEWRKAHGTNTAAREELEKLIEALEQEIAHTREACERANDQLGRLLRPGL